MALGSATPYAGDTLQWMEQYLVHTDPRFAEARKTVDQGRSVSMIHPDNPKLKVTAPGYGQLKLVPADVPAFNYDQFPSGVPFSGTPMKGMLDPASTPITAVYYHRIKSNNTVNGESTYYDITEEKTVYLTQEAVKNAWKRQATRTTLPRARFGSRISQQNRAPEDWSYGHMHDQNVWWPSYEVQVDGTIYYGDNISERLKELEIYDEFTGHKYTHDDDYANEDPILHHYGFVRKEGVPVPTSPVEIRFVPHELRRWLYSSGDKDPRTTSQDINPDDLVFFALQAGYLTIAEAKALGMECKDLEKQYEESTGNGWTTTDRWVELYIPWSSLKSLTFSEWFGEQEHAFELRLDASAVRLDSIADVTGTTGIGDNYTMDTIAERFWQLNTPFDITDAPGTRADPYGVYGIAPFNSETDVFTGVTFEYSVSAELNGVFDEYQSEAAPAVLPDNWRDPHYTHRVKGHGGYLLRHPLMPASLEAVVCVHADTGEVLPLRRYGDWLLVGDPADGTQGTAGDPYFDPWGFYVYFQDTREPTRAAADAALAAVTTATKTDFEAHQDRTPAGRWEGAQHYVEDRRSIWPTYQVRLLPSRHADDDALDVSDYVSTVTSRSITLFLPRGMLTPSSADHDLEPLKYRMLTVTSPSGPLYSGMITSLDTEPSANWTRITVQTSPFKEFHNVDLSALDKESIGGTGGILKPYPSDDRAYLIALLRRAGFTGALKDGMGTYGNRVSMRDTGFWENPAQGPGLLEDEVLDVYWTNDSGSTLQEIRSVANANMLDVFDLPDGHLLLAPILPAPEKSLEELLTGALKLFATADGRWYSDPRVDLSGVRLNLSEGFSEIEIEGYSNMLEADLVPGLAPFYFDQDGEKNAMVRSLDAGTTDSNTSTVWPYIYKKDGIKHNPTTPNAVAKDTTATAAPEDKKHPVPFNDVWTDTHPANERPWNFGESDEHGASLWVVPVDWFKEVGLDFHPDLIKVDTVAGSGRYVNGKGFYVNPISDFDSYGAAPPTGYATWAEWFNAKFGLASTTQVAWGIWAQATGGYFRSTTFQFKVGVPKVDSDSIRVLPFLGKLNDRFQPRWFPGFSVMLESFKQAKPRKAKRIQNPFVSQIGSQYVVQPYSRHHDTTATVTADGGLLDIYDKTLASQADQLATWLTVREFLSSRSVTLSLAGNAHLSPNQFVAMARRPAGGPGEPVEIYDLLMVLDTIEPSGTVGGESWTRVQAAYVGWVNVAEATSSNHMPVHWAGVWEPAAGGGSSMYTDNPTYQFADSTDDGGTQTSPGMVNLTA